MCGCRYEGMEGRKWLEKSVLARAREREARSDERSLCMQSRGKRMQAEMQEVYAC